jgi:single-stranded-DNA-specific exonuclease
MVAVVERKISSDVAGWAASNGFPRIVSEVIGRRFSDVDLAVKNLAPRLSAITSPSLLPDIDKACERIIKSILSGEKIYCAVDYDNDGVSSGAILYRGLTEVFDVPHDQVSLVSGVRFTEGYGLSKGLAERIADESDGNSVLVVTADMGTSDEDRIKWLKERQIDVVVTDHHAIPVNGIPASACAVVNPTRDDSEFGDSLIAGCGVAWFLIARMASICTVRGICGFTNDASIAAKKRLVIQLTSFACSGTIGDCVSLSRSTNNRALCITGLHFMREGSYPCWRAFKGLMAEGHEIDSTDIAFTLSPMSNACGRLVRADAALAFLISNDDSEAQGLISELQSENEERKRIESVMREKAVSQAKKQFEQGRICAVIYLEDGHPGVQGICASRVVEVYGKPTCIFSKKGDGTTTLTASLRSVNGVNIKKALDTAFNALPDGTPRTFGGHEFAAGASIDLTLFETFSTAMNEACTELANSFNGELAPVLEYDGSVRIEELTCESLSLLNSIGPFGREFPVACFSLSGIVQSCALIGKEKNHLKLRLLDADSKIGIDCIQFFIDREESFIMPEHGQVLSVIGEPQENWFKGRCRPQLIMRKFDIKKELTHD